jgi:hypothetical protein
MSNDCDRELMWNVVKGFGIQGEHSAGRHEPRGTAGILGGRTSELEEEHEDGDKSPWTGWAVGTVVPDEVPAANAEPDLALRVVGFDAERVAARSTVDGPDEDLLRIVIRAPRASALDPIIDAEPAPDDHTELDELAGALVAKSRIARGTERISPLRADADEDEDDLDDLDDLDDDEDGEDDEDGDDELDNDNLDDGVDLSPPVSRKYRPRHRRRDRPRSKTIALKRLTREELRRGALENPPVEGVERPHTRAECRDAPRPCPWVACKHHLYLDINPRTGSIKINFPDLEPWELQHTCALDVADGGGLTLEEIGVITNLTRERVRQVEVRGLLTLKARSRSLR